MASTSDVLKSKPGQKDLDQISKSVGDNWRSLLTQLGEDSATIEGFLLRPSSNTIEACFKGLVHWLEGNADKPVTWETLLKALREADMKGYAEDLEKKLKLEGPSQDNTSEQMSQLESCDMPASDRSGSDTREQSNEVKSHTGLTESKAKDSKPTVQPSTPLRKECTDNIETQDSSSPKGPPMKHFYRILESTTCTPQAFEVRYRHIRKDGMTNIKLSRELWERVRDDSQADPLIKCVYFCLGMTSAPENLDYILQTWNDLSQQLTTGKSFEIGSLFGFYLIAWTIYNCAEYGPLPSNTENIPLLGLPQQKITRSKDGAMKLIDYCIEQTDSMSSFPLKPFFHITKLRWEFEYKRFMGDLDESVAKTLLKGIDEVVQLRESFDQDWMKIDSFGAIGSAINLKIEIAIHFKERIRDASMFGSLQEEACDNLKKLTEYFEKNHSVIPIYDEAWLYSVQSKFCRMIGAEAHRYAEDAARLYLECGRHWRALEEAKHTGDSKLIQYYQSTCSNELKTGTQYDTSLCCVYK